MPRPLGLLVDLARRRRILDHRADFGFRYLIRVFARIGDDVVAALFL
jgi:hypothetical protein